MLLLLIWLIEGWKLQAVSENEKSYRASERIIGDGEKGLTFVLERRVPGCRKKTKMKGSPHM